MKLIRNFHLYLAMTAPILAALAAWDSDRYGPSFTIWLGGSISMYLGLRFGYRAGRNQE